VLPLNSIILQEDALRLSERPAKKGTQILTPFRCDYEPIFVSQFTSVPSSSSSDETPSYGFQGSFGPTISALMHTYNTSPPVDELTRAQTELNQVKDIMVQNVEQILSRGERIELLVDKTDAMAGQATAFRRGARNIRREMWWRNSKVVALSVIVALVSALPFAS
jgi:vesicle-associated membrane protein 7